MSALGIPSELRLNATPSPALTFASTLCLADRFKEYVADGTNRTEVGWRSAEQAVASGRPYFGTVDTEAFLAVDCDDPSSIELAEFKAIVDAGFGLDFLEVDSGADERSGRHLYVALPDDLVGARLRRECRRLNAKAKARGCPRPVLDVRKTIRPPCSPHRSSGRRAEPLNMDEAEALDFVRAHARRHDTHTPRPARTSTFIPEAPNADATPTGQVHDLLVRLPGPVVELLNGKAPTEARFYTEAGALNRHKVDAKVALHCVLAGFDWRDYLALRAVFPSAKAAEKTPEQATAYLLAQFESAKQKVLQSHLDVVATLDHLEAAIESLDFPGCKTRATADKARLVTRSFVAKARELDRLEFAWSRRDISLASGLRKAMVDRVLASDGPLATLGIIVHGEPTQPAGHALTYRLAPPNVAPTGRDGRDVLAVRASHPLFRASPGLGVGGYRTLSGYSTSIPRRRADAHRLAGGADRISRTAFHRHSATLLGLDLLVADPDDDRLLLRATSVDYDALADALGSTAIAERAQLRTVLERRSHRTYVLDPLVA